MKNSKYATFSILKIATESDTKQLMSIIQYNFSNKGFPRESD